MEFQTARISEVGLSLVHSIFGRLILMMWDENPHSILLGASEMGGIRNRILSLERIACVSRVNS